MKRITASRQEDSSGLRARLRRATQPAHRQLEAALGLLEDPVTAHRILGTLQRLHGFHAAWEPALAPVVPAPVLLPRLKLPLLEQDLHVFGATKESLHNAPACHAAALLCRNPAAAAGTLYVMEGGTLGGQVIVRSLEHTGWFSSRRPSYWNPYGADTGRRWSETVTYLESLPDRCADEAIASAIACFELLQSWLLQEQRATLG